MIKWLALYLAAGSLWVTANSNGIAAKCGHRVSMEHSLMGGALWPALATLYIMQRGTLVCPQEHEDNADAI